MRLKVTEKRAIALCALMLAGCVFVSGWAVLAQEAQKKQEPPVLRVTTHLVLVSTIVQDKNGHPVTDLKKEDFELLEHGKEQVISTFALESSRALPHAVAALPPNTYTNRLEQRIEAPTSISVILLDGINTNIGDQSYARANIVKFLEQIQPLDRVAIYTMGRGAIRVLHDFSSDPSSLIAALKKYRGRQGHEVDASSPDQENTGIALLDDFIAEANSRMASFYSQDRAINTTRGLEAIAGHLARFPGRKNLIWVSASFPISVGMEDISNRYSRSFYAETEKAARALSNANVAIYPVDARGLVGAFPNPNFNRAGSVTGRGIPRPGVTTLSDIGSGTDTMNLLADRTGGKAFYNRNDIDGAVRSAIEDSRVSYVLGYYPTHGKWDGRFVDLKVKVSRPGMRVRYRKGYYAGAEIQVADKELMTLLSAAAHSPLESSSVGMTVRAEDVPNAPAKSLKLSMEIDPQDINLILEEGRWVGSLDFLFSQRNVEGGVVSSFAQNLELRLTPESHDQLEKQGITISRTIAVDPNASLLRVVVRDARSGAIGTVSIPLKPITDKRGG